MPIKTEDYMTPSEFVRIVTGKYMKDVIPADGRTYIFIDGEKRRTDIEAATNEQIIRLHSVGIHRTKGLSRRQAAYLLKIIEKRESAGLAKPWQIKHALRIVKFLKFSAAEKTAVFAKLTVEEIECFYK